MFQSFTVLDEELESDSWTNSNALLRFDGRPKSKTWKAPKVKILKPKLKKGDFFGFNDGAFAVSPAAWERCAMFLEMAGELLSLPYQQEKFAVLNVTECIDCLDDAKSEWAKVGSTRRLVRPAFVPSLFGESSIFKHPYSWVRTYCYEESCDPETEFKAFVEKQRLTGLKFNPIWTDEK
jgi:hypothetical protein